MAQSNPSGESRTIKSVEKTLRILEALKRADGAGLTEIADRVELSHGSVHHYLMSLQKHGYVVKNDGEYHMGVRFFSLGGYARHKEELYRESREKIDDLAVRTGETARLVIEQDGHCITLYQASESESTPTNTYAGFEEAPNSTAAGKAILAALPDEKVTSIIDRHGLPSRTENTITDEAELYEELEQISSRGYAVDDEECFEGLLCIADSVTTPAGAVLGAISISAPVDRIDRDRFIDDAATMLNNTTGVLEISHTYSQWQTE